MHMMAAALSAALGAHIVPCAAPFPPRATAASLGLGGVPGLFEIPAAVAAAPGTMAVAFHNARSLSALPGTVRQRNLLLAFEFLPRLTIGARAAVIDDTVKPIRLRDLSANAQLRLRDEGGGWPALAVGAMDASGANALYHARYAVATKTWMGRLQGTVGYGTGAGQLDGAFGALVLGPCRWVMGIAEHDGRQRNIGVRLAPFPERAGIVPVFDLLARGETGVVGSLSVRVRLPGSARDRATPEPARADAGAPRTPGRPRDSDPATASGSSTVTRGTAATVAALVAYGFENVRAALTGADSGTIDVAYENRRFNRDEWDALGVVMAMVAERAPQPARRMRLRVHRLDLPMLGIAARIGDFESFLLGTLSAEAFAASLAVDDGHRPVSSELPAGARGETPMGAALDGGVNPSRGRVDLFVRPRVETMLMSEVSVAEARMSVLPEAVIQLGRGMTASARRAIVLHTTPGYSTDLRDPNADRLLLNVARPFAMASASTTGAFAQLSAGRFGHREVGAAVEIDVPVAGGRASLAGMVGAFGERALAPDRSVANGTLRVRHAALGLTASVSAGRYLHGDVGGGAELQRLFGASELAFFVKRTEFGSVAGMRVGVPLTVSREPRPARVRLRLPDYHEQSIHSTVFAEYPAVRTDVAQPLETGTEVGRVLRGRDRLHAPVLKEHVDAIRRAALRWVAASTGDADGRT